MLWIIACGQDILHFGIVQQWWFTNLTAKLQVKSCFPLSNWSSTTNFLEWRSKQLGCQKRKKKKKIKQVIIINHQLELRSAVYMLTKMISLKREAKFFNVAFVQKNSNKVSISKCILGHILEKTISMPNLLVEKPEIPSYWIFFFREVSSLQ